MDKGGEGWLGVLRLDDVLDKLAGMENEAEDRR